jgi:hypothetical protein
VTFSVENLNTAVDHPGTPFAKAATVGMEAWASSDSELALERFRETLTLAR